MSKKSVETYMKKAMTIEAPEEVWEKIKDAPIAIKTISEKKKSNVMRYSIMTSAAACAVIVLSVVITKQNNLWNPKPIGENITLDAGSSESITEPKTESKLPQESKAEQQTSAPVTVPPKSEPSVNPSAPTVSQQQNPQIGGIRIHIYRVWNHRFYRCSDKTLKEEDLDQMYSVTVNDNPYTVYSIKGESIDNCFAWKANEMICYYKCIYNGVFSLSGKEYGLMDRIYYVYPSPEKGKYLGEIDGLKVYQFVGNDKAVLVDMAPVIASGDSECLYVAELLE